MLQNNPELKGKIDQLWNKCWSGGVSNPSTASGAGSKWMKARSLPGSRA
ncbi:hypothetical protein [Desulfonatronovibrio hydrogenovorans]|nr:hypothetical protein [Desulfonatronovibrio hydrogenovorans]